MGHGPTFNGKQMPVTPYRGSWAWDMEQRSLNPNPPLAHNLPAPLGNPKPKAKEHEPR